MNIVKTGTKYRLFDKSVETGDALPAIALEVGWAQFEGFFLKETDTPDLRGETVYGDSAQKVEKVFKSYNTDKVKNLGVILSGEKGIGKTLFAKMAAIQAIKNGLPVIYVNNYFGGLPGFFRNITQDCLIIFDEFDKNFVSNSKEDRDETCCQDEMLTMFDGIYGGHKMFIITCNDVDKLSDFYINRPGRFRYHIRFGYPSVDEVRKYMTDKIGKHKDIDQIVRFSGIVPLSYDCLSAIAAEIKMGESFKSAMSMLNIVNVDTDTNYDTRFTYDFNGRTITETVEWHENIPMFANDGTENNRMSCAVRHHGDGEFGKTFCIGQVIFTPSEIRKFATPDKSGAMSVATDHFVFKPYDEKSVDKERRAEFKEIVAAVKPLKLTFKPSFSVPAKISYEHVL